MRDEAREVRQALHDPRHLVAVLGLQEGSKAQPGGVMIRCPWHGEDRPSCSVRSAADGTVSVRCFACDHTGDALDLVAVARGIDKRDFRRLVEEAARLAGMDSAPALVSSVNACQKAPTVEFPPVAEVEEFWGRSAPTTSADVETAWFMASRSWSPAEVASLDIVRVLPQSSAKWWPSSWSKWRLGIRAYRCNGTLATIHARAVVDVGDGPKTRWPYKSRATGVLFANQRGVNLLKGTQQALGGVLIVEGLTDTLTASLRYQRAAYAVLGVTSGNAATLGDVKWPSGQRIVVWTDSDKAGDKYAEQIHAALPDFVSVVRLRQRV